MNIRNVSQLKHAHYTGSGSHNSSFLISAPGANKKVAIFAILNSSGSTLHVNEADDASDVGGDLLCRVPNGGTISLEAPIVLAPNQGVIVDATGCTILYTILEN